MENIISFALGMARQFSPAVSAALFVGSLAVMGLCFAAFYFFLRAGISKKGENARRTREALEELGEARKEETRLNREATFKAVQDEEMQELKDWMDKFDRTEEEKEVALLENKVSFEENIPDPPAEDVSVEADKHIWMEVSQIYRALFGNTENTPPGRGKNTNG